MVTTKLTCSRLLIAGLLALAIMLPTARGQQISVLLNIQVLDDGSYDAYGESDPRRDSGGAGFGALSHVRGPMHSYLVFHIPPFAGTVTNAYLIGNAYM